eukprot:TRINITY_DN1904_c0_g1_i1.p1 TRINITY_DN1904_c0_g1~~TRINITY_DN1904_c0_g1_i1.p1  ORF type:complete len:480 (-),score=106.47 TRINITY_DN1904_c0_g1_i1:118-1509(-)
MKVAFASASAALCVLALLVTVAVGSVDLAGNIPEKSFNLTSIKTADALVIPATSFAGPVHFSMTTTNNATLCINPYYTPTKYQKDVCMFQLDITVPAGAKNPVPFAKDLTLPMIPYSFSYRFQKGSSGSVFMKIDGKACDFDHIFVADQCVSKTAIETLETTTPVGDLAVKALKFFLNTTVSAISVTGKNVMDLKVGFMGTPMTAAEKFTGTSSGMYFVTFKLAAGKNDSATVSLNLMNCPEGFYGYPACNMEYSMYEPKNKTLYHNIPIMNGSPITYALRASDFSQANKFFFTVHPEAVKDGNGTIAAPVTPADFLVESYYNRFPDGNPSISGCTFASNCTFSKAQSVTLLGSAKASKDDLWYVVISSSVHHEQEFTSWINSPCAPSCSIRGVCQETGDKVGFCDCISLDYTGLACEIVEIKFGYPWYFIMGIVAFAGFLTILVLILVCVCRGRKVQYEQID